MFGFLNFGRKRRRKNARIFAGALPGFDAQFYLATNPDVQESGMDPLVHFLRHGWKEGRDPSHGFRIEDYLQNNPDVRGAGVNPLVHFLEFGLAEGRNFRSPGTNASQSEHDTHSHARRPLALQPSSSTTNEVSGDDERLALRRLWAHAGAEQKMTRTSLILGYDPPVAQSEK